jgi:DNA-binding CsgD family transcriptional regulator
LLLDADAQAPLSADDLNLLGQAAYLAGDPAWNDAWTRAHHQYLAAGQPARACRCAFWLGLAFMNAGEMAQCGGWLTRSERIVEEIGECVEGGYLIIPTATNSFESDTEGSLAAFRRALAIGERFRDPDLIAMARHGEARCIIQLGDPAKGMAMLDEVLVALNAGELSPIVTGDTYCGAVEACQVVFDVGRGREWTHALRRWCDSQPDLAPFRGQCLTYVSAMTQTQGDWAAAVDVASQACQLLAGPPVQPAVGAAYYQRAELERLRGALADAEESYRRAGAHGRDPQPGLALLRLAQGQAAAAASSIRRVLEESADPVTRSCLLPAAVEILLGAGDRSAARAAANELLQIAEPFDAPLLLARASYALGSVLVAEGDHRAALTHLRHAFATLHALDAPYEAAVARVLIGSACDALGDRDGADVEWKAARDTFEQLGAAPDLARLARLTSREPALPGGLTARELDILRLVATGRTNRAIGDELVISEKTVARHVANIFNKLGVSSRSAATAFAYDHGLVQRPA